jgi:hemolysin III
MIGLLIAGTFTPLGLLVLSNPLARTLLAVTWGGAFAGSVFHVLWIDAPKWLSASVHMAVGWSAIAAMPQLVTHVGWGGTSLLALGGGFYSAGAAVYTLRRPDPAPAVFGYHEVFHALVVVAASLHYAFVALYIVPRA